MNIRKSHRTVALIITIPLLVTTLTGLILQLRNEFEYLQPKAVSIPFSDGSRLVNLQEVAEKFGTAKIDQIIWRPSKSSLVVRLKNGNEAHLHPVTGEVLKQSQRRTNFLIELHQGSWMGKWGQYLIHFLSGLGLFFLIISGLFIAKRKYL